MTKRFEVFQFWCCGKMLETDAERKVTCSECKKVYEVELSEFGAGTVV